MSISTSPLFQRLLDESFFSERELITLIASAPWRYKRHLISKRNGGMREISQPTREIKYLQRLLVQRELHTKLPIHDCSIGYRAGLSIRDHAQPHAEGRYLLKLDFSDFFKSLKRSGLAHRLSIDTGYSDAERFIIENLVTCYDRRIGRFNLAIGAPSSPFISNYLMIEFDRRMEDFCKTKGVQYTRYADDLAFSTRQRSILTEVESEVNRVLQELPYLELSLNVKKTVNASKKNRRSLVGLILSNDGRASIGRDAKRDLRVGVFKASTGTLSGEELSSLRGRLAFVNSVDPDFVVGVLRRYGFSRIADL